MSFRMKAMLAECTILGADRDVELSEDGNLIIKGVSPHEFMPLVALLANVPVPTGVPTAVPTVQASPPPTEEPAGKVLGKRRAKTSRKTTAKPVQKSAAVVGTGSASSPRAAVADHTDEEPAAVSNGVSNGSAASPRETVAAVDPEDALQLELAERDEEFPAPEGWENCIMDGKVQVVHTACGAADECLCNISEETPEEEDAAYAEETLAAEAAEKAKKEEKKAKAAAKRKAKAAEKKAAKAASAADDIATEPETASEEGAKEEGEDPLRDDLRTAKRLVNVVAKLVEAGFAEPDDIIEQCYNYRDAVPLLSRIPEASFKNRVSCSIEVNL